MILRLVSFTRIITNDSARYLTQSSGKKIRENDSHNLYVLEKGSKKYKQGLTELSDPHTNGSFSNAQKESGAFSALRTIIHMMIWLQQAQLLGADEASS
jgi:hypothetical protein